MEKNNNEIASKQIGGKIKKLRELKNLTQSHMAEKLGLSQSAYSKIELGETEISYKRLTQIANVLNLKPEEITNFSDNMVFNVMHNQNGQNGFVVNNNSLSIGEKELYERQISLLLEERDYLKNLINKWMQRNSG
jgi:transcriptional regulator with XRE-family HTH domain